MQRVSLLATSVRQNQSELGAAAWRENGLAKAYIHSIIHQTRHDVYTSTESDVKYSQNYKDHTQTPINERTAMET